MRIIRGAVRLARSDGNVVLVHYLREAERETYNGFPQWNFQLRDGKAALAEAAFVAVPAGRRPRGIVIRPEPGV